VQEKKTREWTEKISVCAYKLSCGGIKSIADVVEDLNRIQLPGLNQHFGFG